MSTNSNYHREKSNADHYFTYVAEMTEDGFNSEFAPITRNMTSIGITDPGYKKWLKGLSPARKREIDQQNERFQNYNNGTHNWKWRDSTWLKRGDDWNLCNAISGLLELTKTQKDSVWQLYDRYVNMTKYPGQLYGEGTKRPLVVFCLCTLIHNNAQHRKSNGDCDTRWAYYPTKKNYQPRRTYDGTLLKQHIAENDRYVLFQQFADSLGLDDDTISSCLEKLRRNIPEFRPDSLPAVDDGPHSPAENRIFHTKPPHFVE